MSDVRFGLIGCGNIGPSLADGVRQADGAELIACADLVPENARAVADEHGCEPYGDHEEMLAGEDLEAGIVATPSGTHGELTTDCAEAGLHVLTQKPLEVRTERLDRMIAACDDAGVTLAGVFPRRFRPGPRRAKQMLDDGELGTVHLANAIYPGFRSDAYYASGEWRGTRDLDGGVLFNQCVHMIDQVAWYMDGIEAVYAHTDTITHDIECEDVATVNVWYGNGATGVIEATTSVYDHPESGRVEVYGEDGYVYTDARDFLECETREKGAVEIDESFEKSGFAVQIQDLAAAIREDREPAVTGREARHAPDAIIAMYASSERDERVTVDEIRREREVAA